MYIYRGHLFQNPALSSVCQFVHLQLLPAITAKQEQLNYNEINTNSLLSRSAMGKNKPLPCTKMVGKS